MAALHSQYTLIILALLLCLLTVLRSLFFRRRLRQQSQFLAETHECMEDLQVKLGAIRKKNDTYSTIINTQNHDKLTVNLQQSRLPSPSYSRTMSPPERYRYVRSFVENGMSSEEIASILSISNHEADQLVNLSRLSRSS